LSSTKLRNKRLEESGELNIEGIGEEKAR